MAVSRALRRLLHIRNLEEEQSRLAVESALVELRRLEHALSASVERGRRGRRLITLSARNGELPDRVAGAAEMGIANAHAAALTPWIAEAEGQVSDLRDEFLLRRVERRQAQTLIDETEERDRVDAARRGQQALDDWYGSRLHGEKSTPAQPGQAGPERSAQPDAGPAPRTDEKNKT